MFQNRIAQFIKEDIARKTNFVKLGLHFSDMALFSDTFLFLGIAEGYMEGSYFFSLIS